MKHLIFFLLFCSCNIHEKVIDKLLSDEKSFLVYLNICIESKKDNEVAYDLYLKLYNQGVPLARLFEYETIIKSYETNCDFKTIKKNYKSFVSKKKNYINDERKDDFFQRFIDNYFIIPDSD